MLLVVNNINLRRTNEAPIQADLREWLKKHFDVVEMEWRIKSGSIDLYLPNRRVVIEVKDKNKLPDGVDAVHKANTGSSKDETVYEQLQRYVKDESERERSNLEKDVEDLPWYGAITDGTRWWIYSIDMNMVFSETEYKGQSITNTDNIIRMFDRKVGLDWAPADLSDFFKDDLTALQDMYLKRSALQATKTKKKLWFQQLEISGNAPLTKDQDDLFVLHSFMIVVSSGISNSIAPDLTEKNLGFVEWVSGSGWYKNINEKIASYNWKQRSGDILRKMYMDYIPEQHRKIYGEFYTPDWLAEKLCSEVIDDEFISNMIVHHYDGYKKPLQILDPACGSGTFLFHSIRRVLESDVIKDSGMSKNDQVSMLTDSIYGIDIHPVAVYMARTNMLRALPSQPSRTLKIWQGDSMQTRRSGSNMVLGEDKDTCIIYSSNDKMITLPKAFLLQDHAFDGISRLVNTANEGKPFPLGLDAGLKPHEIKILKSTHDILANVCKTEGNGVWAWYIINQVASFILTHDRVSRIVSNPPWVVLNNIQVTRRKEEIINAAKDQNLWVGGRTATSFDMASLFVDKCISLYLDKTGISGWVLPATSLKGDSWSRYRKHHRSNITQIWDLNTLPFPEQANTCVNIIQNKNMTIKPIKNVLVKNKNTQVFNYDSWNTVEAKTSWKPFLKEYTRQSSGYAKGGKADAKMGATLVPQNLIRIETSMENDDEISFTTKRARHAPWKQLGTFQGNVPKHYVSKVLFAEDVFPYRISKTPNKCIIPFNETRTGFDKEITNQYWKDAEDYYKANKGKGSNTPKTLLGNINYQNKLSKQLENQTSYMVVLPKNGQWMCAAYSMFGVLIDNGLYKLEVKTEHEARYLTAILNSESLQLAYQNSKRGPYNFDTHFWHEIPIPRYNKNDKNHAKLAELAKKAERVAKSVQNPDRKKIRMAMIEDGVSQEIDEIIYKILPKHTEKITKQQALDRL